ncbi:MAG: SLC13 family permease [Haloferacaceae archaeon]
MLVVFAVIALALVLFVTEPVPIDVTAVALLVTLAVLEPYTTITPADAIAGFASPATITVLAMFVLSEGVRRTGVVRTIGERIVEWTGDDAKRQLAAVIGLSGGSAGFVNNTPVVAVMIPMVTNIANRTRTSPSTLLMPLSFASMMGGTLTLIGTSTNILASDVYDRIGGAETTPFGMFEFTALGLLVLAVGSLYLFVASPLLVPERIKPREELTEEFEMTQYLTEVVVTGESPFVGKTVAQCFEEVDIDVDLVQLVRGEHAFTEPLARKEVRAGDVFVLRTDQDNLIELIETEGLTLAPDAEVDDTQLRVEEGESDIETETEQRLVEVVITPDSGIVGETLETLSFRHRYDATVLAIRRGEEIIHARMDERPLRGGDTLLLQASDETVGRLARNRAFVVAGDIDRPQYRQEKTPVAVGIVGAVVFGAAFTPFPIVLTALAGMVAMVVTGCLKPNEMYEAVDWNVIFLLAGVIPLGVAMERTGGAEWLAATVLSAAGGYEPIVLLGVFYLVTAVLTNLVSNNASVVLMIPVAFDAAAAIGANVFSFVLAVTFAASTAFMTPVGYQTNLMVYGPGGYRFSDFARVGGPLQLLLAVVTTLGIAAIWGVCPPGGCAVP